MSKSNHASLQTVLNTALPDTEENNKTRNAPVKDKMPELGNMIRSIVHEELQQFLNAIMQGAKQTEKRNDGQAEETLAHPLPNKEIVVPVGIYKIGEDIPVGRYTIRCPSERVIAKVQIGTAGTDGRLTAPHIEKNLFQSPPISAILNDGDFLDISGGPVIMRSCKLKFDF